MSAAEAGRLRSAPKTIQPFITSAGTIPRKTRQSSRRSITSHDYYLAGCHPFPTGRADPIAAVLDVQDAHKNCVEILVGIKGLPQAAFTRAIEIPFGDSSLRVVGYEDFLAMKLSAGGPQDLLDVDEALKVNPHFNEELVRELVRGYGKEAARRFNQAVQRLAAPEEVAENNDTKDLGR